MTIDDIKYGYYFYLYFFFKYFSFKKFSNLLRCWWEYLNKKEKLRSFPIIASIDPANVCILNCPLCPTGRGDKGVKKNSLIFDEFRQYFDQMKDYLFFVRLYNWGEPFLAKDIFKMVNHAHKNNVGVIINSNLNVYKENLARNIVESGPDYLMISIDGVAQRTYEIYRRSGNLKKVFNLIKEIDLLKKKLKTSFPILHWSYLVHRRNRQEIEMAKTLAHKIGFDLITFSRLSLVTKIGDKILPENKAYWLGKEIISQRGEKTPASACYFLWASVNISPNGDVFPCCGIYEDKYNFGNLKKDSLEKVWNNQKFCSARRLFRHEGGKQSIRTICQQCDWFKK